MATGGESEKTTHKRVRHKSKSPKRHHFRTQAPPDLSFDAKEFAYANPFDSSRALVHSTCFERRDKEHVSSQVNHVLASKDAFDDDAERSWLVQNMHSTEILIKVEQTTFKINGNYIFKENQPCVLFLHGFGLSRNWANWLKLAYPLFLHNQSSVIFVDLPGFGQSSGRDLDQTSWKRYGPEIIIAILSSFHLRQSVNVVAQCGGAATAVRTMNRYPLWFRDRGHVFSNSVIGDFGESKPGEFEMKLTKYNIHIVVYWIPDEDHTKLCVAYKRWSKLRSTGFRNLQLIDLDPSTQTMKLFYPVIHAVDISRGASKNEAYVYKLSEEFVQQVINTIGRK